MCNERNRLFEITSVQVAGGHLSFDLTNVSDFLFITVLKMEGVAHDAHAEKDVIIKLPMTTEEVVKSEATKNYSLSGIISDSIDRISFNSMYASFYTPGRPGYAASFKDWRLTGGVLQKGYQEKWAAEPKYICFVP
jgi:hypothetical protein